MVAAFSTSFILFAGRLHGYAINIPKSCRRSKKEEDDKKRRRSPSDVVYSPSHGGADHHRRHELAQDADGGDSSLSRSLQERRRLAPSWLRLMLYPPRLARQAPLRAYQAGPSSSPLHGRPPGDFPRGALGGRPMIRHASSRILLPSSPVGFSKATRRRTISRLAGKSERDTLATASREKEQDLTW